MTGTLTIAGRPAEGEQVVLFAPGKPPLLDVATSEAGGRFAFDVDGDVPAGAGVLAKVRGEAVGLAWAELEGAPLALDVAGPFHPVRIRLTGADAPPELTLWLDPETTPGPPHAARLVHLAGPRVREAHYLRRPLAAGGGELRLAPGAWRLGAEALWPDRVPGFGPNPDRAAVRAVVDGQELAGNRTDGFLLDVAGALDVTLELAEV